MRIKMLLCIDIVLLIKINRAFHRITQETSDNAIYTAKY